MFSASRASSWAPSTVDSERFSSTFSATSPTNESIATHATSDFASPPTSQGATDDFLMGNDWEDWTVWADKDWADGISEELIGTATFGDLDQIGSPVGLPSSSPNGFLFSSPTFDLSLPFNSAIPGDHSMSTCAPSNTDEALLTTHINTSHASIASRRQPQLQSIVEEPFRQTPSSGGTSQAAINSKPSLPSKKRKSGSICPADASEIPQAKHIKHQDKNLHGKVEKRYRMKLNDQLSGLRDCIPDLVAEGASISQYNQKVNKSTILTKAREYILQLEADNKKLVEEKKVMARQLELTKQAASIVADQSFGRPHEPGPQRHALSRLIIAGLAGVMATEGWHASESGNHAFEDRGLFSVPTWLLGQLTHSRHHLSLIHQVTSPSMAFVLHLRVLLPLGAIILAVYLIWGLMLEGTPRKAAKAGPPTTFHHYAFSTAKQSVWVPDGRTLELAAIALEILRLGLRRIGVGLGTNSSLPNPLDEDEAARAKAWDVALDAQLTGGDTRINSRRLIQTLLAGSSLPATPYRRMLMAVHVHVLASSLNMRFYGHQYVHRYINKLIRRQWETAQTIQKQRGQEGLPNHLRRLLDLDVEEVFSDEVVQRLCNLAWQRPPSTALASTAADVVSCDPSVRSPLDALAAWWVALLARDLMIGLLETPHGSEGVDQQAERTLDRALKAAPPGSAVFSYGLAARAILARSRQAKCSADALRVAMALPSDSAVVHKLGDGAALFNGPGGVRSAFHADLTLALRSAIAIACIGGPDSKKANDALSKHLETSTAEPRLLGFVALYRFVETVFRDRRIASKNSEILRQATEVLRVWTCQDVAEKAGVGPHAAGNVTEVCVEVFEWLLEEYMKGGDEGYETLGY